MPPAADNSRKDHNGPRQRTTTVSLHRNRKSAKQSSRPAQASTETSSGDLDERHEQGHSEQSGRGSRHLSPGAAEQSRGANENDWTIKLRFFEITLIILLWIMIYCYYYLLQQFLLCSLLVSSETLSDQTFCSEMSMTSMLSNGEVRADRMPHEMHPHATDSPSLPRDLVPLERNLPSNLQHQQ